MKKTLIIMLTMLLLIGVLSACVTSTVDEAVSQDTISTTSTEGFGAAGALEAQELKLEDMLKYAIQDEYLARQEYEVIMDEFGEQRPFSNIIKAEVTHIAMLTELYKDYDLVLPQDTAIEHVIIPESILEAKQTGVVAEENNIAMYEAFLKQDLPDDIRETFEALKRASEMHLNAFKNSTRQGRGNWK